MDDRLFSMCFLAAFLLASLLAMKRVERGRDIPIRRLEGLDAIQEAIGRATEMGSASLFIIPGGPFDAQAFAAFDILGYVAQETAKYHTKLVVVNALPEAHAISQEIVRQAYKSLGKDDSLDNVSLRFLSTGFTAGVLGVYERDRIGANFLFGSFYFESLTLAEAGQRTGAIQVSGTANTHQLPFLVAACDYSLIGEEIYAAGTYLSRNPAQIGSLVAQEIGKYVGILVISALSIWRTVLVLAGR
ncbi:MAG: DUF6754 domain-containing protein [Bacillota bacterium]|jgi:hypothetical protein